MASSDFVKPPCSHTRKPRSHKLPPTRSYFIFPTGGTYCAGCIFRLGLQTWLFKITKRVPSDKIYILLLTLNFVHVCPLTAVLIIFFSFMWLRAKSFEKVRYLGNLETFECRFFKELIRRCFGQYPYFLHWSVYFSIFSSFNLFLFPLDFS